jgi:hypothetical protein
MRISTMVQEMLAQIHIVSIGTRIHISHYKAHSSRMTGPDLIRVLLWRLGELPSCI